MNIFLNYLIIINQFIWILINDIVIIINVKYNFNKMWFTGYQEKCGRETTLFLRNTESTFFSFPDFLATRGQCKQVVNTELTR